MWYDFMYFVHSSAETQGLMYGLFGMIVSIPAALLGQMLKRIVFMPPEKIPYVLGAVSLASCWVASYFIPEIDRANLITAGGLGGLASHHAHREVIKPGRVMLEKSGVMRPK